jgi:hypothetical protein
LRVKVLGIPGFKIETWGTTIVDWSNASDYCADVNGLAGNASPLNRLHCGLLAQP